jgi:hypothetical protein
MRFCAVDAPMPTPTPTLPAAADMATDSTAELIWAKD